MSVHFFDKIASIDNLPYEQTTGILDGIDTVISASILNPSNATISVTIAELITSLDSFRDFVSSQVVPGQENISYIYPSFRMAAAVVNTHDFANTTVSLNLPQSNLEQNTGIEVSRVIFGKAVVDANNGVAGNIALGLLSTSAWSYPKKLSEAFNSNPLQIKVVSDAAATSDFEVILHHNRAKHYSESINLTTLCITKDLTENFTCPGSEKIIQHNCSNVLLGSSFVSFCPIEYPSCGVISEDANAVSLNRSETNCTILEFDEWSTTCKCSLEIMSKGKLRRLQNAEEVANKVGVMNVVAMSAFVGNDFKETILTAPKLDSVEAVKSVLTVIIMFSVLWSGGIVLIFGCIWRKKSMQATNEKDKKFLQRKKHCAGITRSPATVKEYLMEYVNEIFPAVFARKARLTRLFDEVCRHHRYLKLITAPAGEEGDKMRIITGFELLSVQTMLMFLLALLYDLQDPGDHGTCATYTAESSCESPC